LTAKTKKLKIAISSIEFEAQSLTKNGAVSDSANGKLVVWVGGLGF